ncbi:MAG: TIGR03905 family TSCPD domain-containing protein [Lachnospiraceae bacterium]|nr:TIGR03905 family TSCPD domain-containing protein [Ruminococcus sp.]MCM1275851.1 TIGR03905 family TSCPD domain-containing protein [Lachnospiraceae bacterium]
MKYEYTPRGVCSRKMILEIEDGVIADLKVEGGCNGNLQGISSLVKGMKIDEVIERLSGIRCGSKSTSCPAQLAEALKQFKAEA